MTYSNNAKRNFCITVLLLSALIVAACGEQRFQARAAHDFELPYLSGAGSLSLADTKGDVVYITFWASWCIPCRQEMPYLAELWQRHKNDGFQVVAINVDEDINAARKFAAMYDLPYTPLYDANKAVSERYRVPGYPTHFIIDRKGFIRFSGLGFNLADVATISEEVRILVEESVDESIDAPTAESVDATD